MQTLRSRPVSNVVVTIGVALVLTVAHARAANFKVTPKAQMEGGKVSISFTVDAPTDVTVAVQSEAGMAIRHLAAGVLGPNAPPPLKPDSLSQRIEWDGLDDFGKTADPATCRIRVTAGSRARFGEVLFHEPGLAYSPRSAVVGPDGLIYVLQEHAQVKSTFLLQAYGRDGGYVKTVMPYPANLPPQRLAGLRRFKRPDGGYWPGVFNPSFRDLYPHSTGMRAQRLLITSRGWIIMVNASKTHNGGWPVSHRLLIVDTDGGTPFKDYLGPWTCCDRLAHGFCWIAMSPDEKWVYTCGQRKGNSDDDPYCTPKHQVVYRVGLNDLGRAKPFAGALFKAGSDEEHLNNPEGIDTDAEGNVYVADTGNHRIAVFDAQGKWKGKIDVESPNQVLVNRKNGAVYVYAETRRGKGIEREIMRFPGLARTASARVNVPGPFCAVSLDTTGEAPTLWLAYSYGESPPRGTRHRGVDKIEDSGERLTEPVQVIKPRGLPDVYQIGASTVNDDVFIHSYSEHHIHRVDGKTGESAPLKLGGVDLAAGPNGEVYVAHGGNRVGRYDREGKPLPFPGGKPMTHMIEDIGIPVGGHCETASKGFSVSPRGEIAHMAGGSLCVWSPDGKHRSKLVTGLSKPSGCPVTDLQGNLYLAAELKDGLYPSVFNQGGPPSSRYMFMYGSVTKFPPTGGAFLRKPIGTEGPWPANAGKDVIMLTAPGCKAAAAQGASWVRSGFTCTPSGGNICGCYTSRFTVDRFGRLFMPDNGRFCVHVFDANNNPILTFGDYGNEDSAGPGSKIPKPDIPLSWPYAVSVGRNGVFVSDSINRRIVRVDLVPEAEKTLDLVR